MVVKNSKQGIRLLLKQSGLDLHCLSRLLWQAPYGKYMYRRCSKNSNTSCLLKRPRQTGQTQIRLLLKKQSDQSLLYLVF